jgi:LEA14-like dessication related protein
MRHLSAAVLGVAAALLATGCIFPSGPRVREVDLRVAAINFDQVTAAFDLEVHNPTDRPLPAPHYTLELTPKGAREHCATASGHTQRPIPAGGTANLSLPIEVSYRKAIRRARWLERRATIPYRLRGSLRFAAESGSQSASFSHKGTLPILRAPQFTHIQLKIPKQVSPQMKLRVQVVLTNPNAFPIDIRHLRYQVALGDDDIGGLATESNPVIPPGKSQWVTLAARVNAVGALVKSGFDIKSLIKQDRRIAVRGSMGTPYGTVPLRHDH